MIVRDDTHEVEMPDEYTLFLLNGVSGAIDVRVVEGKTHVFCPLGFSKLNHNIIQIKQCASTGQLEASDAIVEGVKS